MSSRREFIAAGICGLTAAVVGPALRPAAAGRHLKILVLGGTGFLGPHTVRAALGDGHEVTLFNRGRTNPGLFPDLEKLKGDRDGDLESLKGRRWDAVIDTSGYVPRIVGLSVDFLRESVDRYLFVSTISVYASLATPGIDETAPVGRLDDPSIETIDGETYGPLKALCEEVVTRGFGDRAAVIRPGLIVGPGDPTDRFTYWPVRVAAGGDVLAPGDGLDPVQVIDARDLGKWMVTCLETQVSGVYNANSPRGSTDMRRLLETCRTVSGSDARFVWASRQFLEARGVQAWSDMPVWVPRESEFAAAADTDVSRAEAAGLTVRSMRSTVADTLAWFRESRGPEAELRTGLTPARQKALLAAWAANEKR
jgi:2'-hydroxyisoflavone reductase